MILQDIGLVAEVVRWHRKDPGSQSHTAARTAKIGLGLLLQMESDGGGPL